MNKGNREVQLGRHQRREGAEQLDPRPGPQGPLPSPLSPGSRTTHPVGRPWPVLQEDFKAEFVAPAYHLLYALYFLLFLSKKKKKKLVISYLQEGRKMSSTLFNQLTAFLWLATSNETILFYGRHLAKPQDCE